MSRQLIAIGVNVWIYEDPITCNTTEGSGKIIAITTEVNAANGHLYECTIEFGNETGNRYQRTIYGRKFGEDV